MSVPDLEVGSVFVPARGLGDRWRGRLRFRGRLLWQCDHLHVCVGNACSCAEGFSEALRRGEAFADPELEAALLRASER